MPSADAHTSSFVLPLHDHWAMHVNLRLIMLQFPPHLLRATITPLCCIGRLLWSSLLLLLLLLLRGLFPLTAPVYAHR